MISLSAAIGAPSHRFGNSFSLRASRVRASTLLTLVLLAAAPVAFAQQAPIAVNDSPPAVDEGGSSSGTFNVLANDFDPDLDPLTAVLVSGPANASSFGLNASGTFSYTHDGSESTSDSFTYNACDDELPPKCSGATVSFSINPVNDDPTPQPDSVTVAEDSGATTINVLANDSDPDGDALNLDSASANNGTASALPNDRVSYTPDANYFGPDTITYTVSDGNGGTANSTVAVTVTSINDVPVAVNDNPPAINEGGSINNSFDVLANDTDVENDPLTATIVSPPSNASSFSLNANGTFTYTHNGSETILDSFTYRASDGTLSNIATVTITIIPGNDPPVANNDNPPAINEGGSILNTFNVLANDTDAENNPLTAVLVGGPANASAFTLNGNGTFTYTHNGSETTSDSFTYRASDGSLSNVATVTISINSANDPPVAINDNPPAINEGGSINGTFNVLSNDTDAENDSLTAVLVGGPANASTFTLNSNGTFTYTHNGSETTSDSFTYRASDGSLSNVATVTITINLVNEPPVANNDLTSVDEGGAINNTFNVLGNDTDPEDDTLTAVLVNGPTNATTFNLNANGTFSYVHDGSETTSDSFTYQANDGDLSSNTATVSITINSVNDVPVAANDGPFVVDEGATFASGAVSVLDNDTDTENDPLTALLVAAPANASAFTLNADGTFTYTHNGSETLTDSFTYRANDPSPSNVATVSITITPVNDAPTFGGVVPPGLSTPEDTTLTIVIGDLVIDDPDSDTFTLTLEPPALDANYTLAGPASVTPGENFNGQLNVAATVTDDGQPLGIASFTIPVVVEAVNDAPTSTPIESQNAVEDSEFTLDVSVFFDDADGDVLSYTASFEPALPAERNISFDSATGQFSGAPFFNDNDSEDPVYLVTITAEDAESFTEETFDLTISQLGRANLGLEITVSPETASPSDELRWTFTTNNPIGPAPGENVELTGRFVGDGLTVGVVGGASCTVNTQAGQADFTCAVGTLPIGQTVAVQLSTTASQATEVVAFATSAGAQPVPIDPNPNNNSDVRAVGVAESFSQGAVQILGNAAILSMAAGDVNGDGALDIVAGTESGRAVQIYLGAAPRESCGCQRDFETAPLTVPDTGANRGVALADFDNNGTLDLVIVNGGGQPDTVYANDGAGNFSLAATLSPSSGRDVVVGDFNNDGNLDIAVAAASPNPVYFGDGDGGFSNPPILLGDETSHSVAVGRFNGDNLDDLVFANTGAQSRIWTATAGGGFTEVILPTEAVGDAASVAAADLNGDGLDDLVFGRVPASVADIPSNPVLINQGDATFGAAAARLGLSPTRDVLISDIGEDGQPDILFINESGLHQVWTNTGGGFALHSEQIIDIGAAAGVLANLGFADSGDPGGPDLALGGAPAAGVGVYLNDSAGNLGFGDGVAPVITLTGEATINVPAGTAYSAPGATADDNIDGDISSSIVVSNPVNSAVVGAYMVTYNVQDAAGNDAAQVTRTVNVTAATGRGGGGGGAVSHWMLMLLVALQLLALLSVRARDSRGCYKRASSAGGR